jgi:hypothetical protein
MKLMRRDLGDRDYADTDQHNPILLVWQTVILFTMIHLRVT